MTRFNLAGTPKLRELKNIVELTGGYDCFFLWRSLSANLNGS